MSTGILPAAIAGKRCLYATMTRASAFDAMKAMMEHSEMQKLGGELNKSKQVITFPSGGSIKFVTFIDKRDTDQVRGEEFDLANPFAMEWPDVAARVRPSA